MSHNRFRRLWRHSDGMSGLQERKSGNSAAKLYHWLYRTKMRLKCALFLRSGRNVSWHYNGFVLAGYFANYASDTSYAVKTDTAR
jgi:hypothetical protein